jgi:histidyl-tRNA synthetase
VELNFGGGSFKSQLKRADKSGAEFAVVLGDEEIAGNRVGLKPLRIDEDQVQVATELVAQELSSRLKRTID